MAQELLRNQSVEDSEKLFESAIILNLEMTPEERIEAHENVRELMMDLQDAGKALRVAAAQELRLIQQKTKI